MTGIKVFYDVRSSRTRPCVPIIEVNGYRFIGEPGRYSTAKNACKMLRNPDLQMTEQIGKFEFEPIDMSVDPEFGDK